MEPNLFVTLEPRGSVPEIGGGDSEVEVLGAGQRGQRCDAEEIAVVML